MVVASETYGGVLEEEECLNNEEDEVEIHGPDDGVVWTFDRDVSALVVLYLHSHVHQVSYPKH